MQDEQFDFSALQPKKDEATVTDVAVDTREQDSDEQHDEVSVHAARAAEALIAHLPPVESTEKSAAERAYDVLQEQVERAVDQGLDVTATRYTLDPEGKIIEAYNKEIERQQDALNHAEAEKIRQDRFNVRLAAIEAIVDPEERRRAKIEFLARERVADERRGRRW